MNSIDWQGRSADSIGDSPRRSVLDTSSYSVKTKQNSDRQREGESMFEFLRRRKRYALEQKVNESRSRSKYEAATDRTILNQTLDELSAMRVSKHSNKAALLGSLNDRDKFSTISTKKVTFKDQQPNELSTKRTFYEIVSPFKRRAGNEANVSPQRVKDNEAQASTSALKKLKGKQQTMQKKNLLSKLQQTMSYVNGYVKEVEAYKTKSSGLFMEALTLLGEVQNKDQLVKKKIQEIRVAYKAVVRLYQNVEISDPREQLGTLTTELTDSINIIESQLKKAYELQVEEILKSSQEEFKSVIQALQEKLQQTTKQLDNLQYRLDKQANIQNQQSNEQKRNQCQSEKKYGNKLQQLEKKVGQLENRASNLQSSLLKSEQLCKDLDKQNRILQSEKQSLLKSFEIEKEQIASRKEEYLISEMAALKKQCHDDLTNVSELYKIKQVKLMQQINSLQANLQEKDSKLKISLRTQACCSQQLGLVRTQLQRYRIQNEELVRKLNKVTDEAYLYWSTLKEVKVTSTRLGLYGKLARLFEDISFSESTFR